MEWCLERSHIFMCLLMSILTQRNKKYPARSSTNICPDIFKAKIIWKINLEKNVTKHNFLKRFLNARKISNLSNLQSSEDATVKYQCHMPIAAASSWDTIWKMARKFSVKILAHLYQEVKNLKNTKWELLATIKGIKNATYDIQDDKDPTITKTVQKTIQLNITAKRKPCL